MPVHDINHKRRLAPVTQEREEIFTVVIDNLVWLNCAELKEVANEASVSVSTLHYWVYGYTIAPRISTLAKVARALGYELRLSRPRRSKAA